MTTFRVLLIAVCVALGACAKPAAAPTHLSGASLAVRLAHADATRGAQIFDQCAACHTLNEGSGDRDGPNLWGVLGEPVATNSPSFGYTAALKSKGDVWTCARMDMWLANPRGFAPGTIMTFPGLPDGADRADVIAYLARNGGAPKASECRL